MCEQGKKESQLKALKVEFTKPTQNRGQNEKPTKGLKEVELTKLTPNRGQNEKPTKDLKRSKLTKPA